LKVVAFAFFRTATFLFIPFLVVARVTGSSVATLSYLPYNVVVGCTVCSAEARAVFIASNTGTVMSFNNFQTAVLWAG
jgi:hypothetical protein